MRSYVGKIAIDLLARNDRIPKPTLFAAGSWKMRGPFSENQLAPILSFARFLERLGKKLRERDTPVFVGLGGTHHDAATYIDGVLLNQHPASKHVEGRHSKSDRLAPSKARVSEQVNESAMFSCSRCEELNLIGGEVDPSLLAFPRELYSPCRIRRDASIQHSDVEDAREDAVGPKDDCGRPWLTIACSKAGDPRLNV